MGMDVYGVEPKNDAGEHFRANVWSWRPIHALSETVRKKELPSWSYNDGDGFNTQAECDDLANRLEKYMKDFPDEEISLESDIRVTADGRLSKSGGRSAYHTDRTNVQRFCEFLRNCGGFRIC